MATKADTRTEVAFITDQSTVELRFTDHSANTICTAARTLKARFFVTSDGWYKDRRMIGYGVFDMRRADPNGGGPREWAIPDPIKVFPTMDAAIMFALHRRTR